MLSQKDCGVSSLLFLRWWLPLRLPGPCSTDGRTGFGGRVELPYLEFTRDGSPEVIVLDAARVTVGRAVGNDLSFPSEETVSGRHAIVERQSDDWMISDLGSSNGTYVNGQWLDEPWLLRPGDVVTMGRVRLTFRVPRPVAGGANLAESSGYLAATKQWVVTDQVSEPGSAAQLYDQIGEEQPPIIAAADRPPAAPPPYVPAEVAAAPMNTGGSAIVRGVARETKWRRQNDRTVLVFRVERFDPSGNRIAPVGVEFIGYKSGQLSAGEEVEVSGRWKRGTRSPMWP